MEDRKAKSRKGDRSHAGHRMRVRRQYMESGLTGMPPYQVLELILFYALPRVDTKPIAHELIDRYGSVSNVLNAPSRALTSIPGVGEETAAFLKLFRDVSALCRRESDLTTERIGSRADVESVLSPLLTDPSVEQFAFALLDGAGRVIKRFVTDSGGSHSVSASTEMLIREAVLHSAHGIVIAHSHPLSFAAPSRDDIDSTRMLAQRLGAIGVILLDHMIVAPDGVCYLSKTGRFRPTELAFSGLPD